MTSYLREREALIEVDLIRVSLTWKRPFVPSTIPPGIGSPGDTGKHFYHCRREALIGAPSASG